MIQYRIANEKDMDNIIDFINMVFSMLRIPHNFETMLPKAYSKDFAKADIHVLAESEGRICGCLGMYVFPLRVAGMTLQIGYLGSMSVHPRVRGQGTMGELMRRQVERGRELGLDMIILGGQRQRYQYSGFETVGSTYTYNISRSNVRHAFAETDSSSLSIKPMQESDAQAAYSLYDKQIVAGARTVQNFIPSLRSYHKQALSVFDGDRLIGYICASPDKQMISEIVAERPEKIPAILKRWFEEYEIKLLKIQAAPQDLTLHTLLAPVCEGYSLGHNCMMKILHPEKVISAYLALKNSYMPLHYGSLCFKWNGVGTYKINVSENGASIEKTEDRAEVALNDFELYQLFFDSNPYTALEHRRKIQKNWFPLPFHIQEPDTF